MSKKYCMILELKEEHVDDYVKIHKNPWPELLEIEKSAGVIEELIWIYKNIAIVYIECGDIEKVFKILAINEVQKKWNLIVSDWFKDEKDKDHLKQIKTLEKVFDLNQQISGKLKNF